MLGHRLDACASLWMLCASCGCLCIAPDALRIVWMSCALSVMLGHRLMRVHRVWSLAFRG